MQNFPPKADVRPGLARNTITGTLICSQYEAAVKDDENEKCHSAAFPSHGFHSLFTALFFCHTTALMENCILQIQSAAKSLTTLEITANLPLYKYTGL